MRARFGTWSVLLVAIVSACGETRVATSGEGGASTSAETSTVDGGATTGSASHGASTETDAPTGSTSTGAAMDLAYPVACEQPIATIDVVAAITPEGPLEIDEAWLGLDACSVDPYVKLVQLPSRSGPGNEITVVARPRSYTDSFSGLYPARVTSSASTTMGTMDVLDPFEPPEHEVPHPRTHLHARLEAHDDGWDLDVEVDLIYCGETECFCPCR